MVKKIFLSCLFFFSFVFDSFSIEQNELIALFDYPIVQNSVDVIVGSYFFHRYNLSSEVTTGVSVSTYIRDYIIGVSRSSCNGSLVNSYESYFSPPGLYWLYRFNFSYTLNHLNTHTVSASLYFRIPSVLKITESDLLNSVNGVSDGVTLGSYKSSFTYSSYSNMNLKPVFLFSSNSFDYFVLRLFDNRDDIPESHLDSGMTRFYIDFRVIVPEQPLAGNLPCQLMLLYVNNYVFSPSSTIYSVDNPTGEVDGEDSDSGGSYAPGVPEGCTCGACCSDRCKCGNWVGKWCTPFPLVDGGSLGEGSSYRCFHSCPGSGCSHLARPLEYTHCECHHPQHVENSITTPSFESYGLFVPELPDISSPFESPIIPPDLPIFHLPNISLPGFGNLSLPDMPSDSEFEFFNYSEVTVFPEFKFEAMFNSFKDDFEEKIDLSVYERLGEEAQAEHLIWRINHTIMGVSFGPYNVDFSEIISQAKDFTGVSIIRAVLLFILYTIFIYFILRMLFF
jgi:hypothetical protein